MQIGKSLDLFKENSLLFNNRSQVEKDGTLADYKGIYIPRVYKKLQSILV